MHSTRPQRRRPDLNINTSGTSTRSRDAASKPAAPAKSKPPVSSRPLRGPPPMPDTVAVADRDMEESFLDNVTPVELANKENEPDLFGNGPKRKPLNSRDSHDLSLPARQVTRDSLVTNMLMSLDKLSLAQITTPPTPMSPFGEPDDLTQVTAHPGRNTHRPYNHDHGHAYSYSSDLDGTDDGASRISSQFSRGRRSNSSSNFQSGLGRINSMRDTAAPRANNRILHSRGGKTSKSSSTNSFDPGYAQVLSSQRISHGIGGRSSSFDYGQPNGTGNGAPWNLEFSNTFFTDDYEVAPTPNVPAGPSRSAQARPVVTPSAPPPIPKQPDADQRKSLRSRGSTAARAPPSRDAKTRYDMPPPLPANELDSAPAPNVGYEKAKIPPAQTTAPPVKERPGFFRRVFGGSSSRNLDTASSNVTSATPTRTPERQTSSRGPQHIASQVKAPSTPPSRDSHQPLPHVVQKKSSFFRRRKKSVAEAPPLPQPHSSIVFSHQSTRDPQTLDQESKLEPPLIADPAQPSPVSSLRQVMYPYLKGSNPATPSGLLPPRQERDTVSAEYDVEDGELDRRRTSRGFSPDYEPSPNATIRTIKSHSALNSRSRDYAATAIPNRSPKMESPSREPPEIPTARPRLERDETFFDAENSDTEADKLHQPSEEDRTSALLASPAEYEGLPGGFPTPPSTTPRDSPRPQPTPELKSRATEISPWKSNTSNLLTRQSSTSEERLHRPESLGLPIQAQRPESNTQSSDTSMPNRPRSVASVPSFKVQSAETSPKVTGSPLDEPEITIGAPTEDDRQKAQRIFDGNEDFIQKVRAAGWIGEEGPVRQRTLRAYMELYDFGEKSVLTGLREVCDRLILRAETQQIDRILVAFSKRWCECNPNHGFKAMDVIHTMCYSIMLLNTDLHLADIEQKMTRSQFIKNTMTTIKQASGDAKPDAFERPSILPGKNALLSPTESEVANPVEHDRRNWRSSFVPPRSDSRLGDYENADTCGPLVKAPFHGTMRAWEAQMELVLKDIYNSIRDDRLPLFGAAPEPPQPQQSSLSVISMLKRTPSVLSKAPSESPSMPRGRNDGTNRANANRWGSKSRSRPRIGTAGFSSSRTSFDDTNSIWSPTGSSATWSRYSLGRTQTSPSMDSLGPAYSRGDFKQSIGFANALSQAIIREDHTFDTSRSIMSEEIPGAALLDDESLELTGPPWVKEGIVIHKHHLDGVDKKAKDRNWSEVFAVIQKGSMSIFSFSTKSMRQKGRMSRKHAPGDVVGGGNWQENATNLGTFSLRQTLASALPAPGYSRTRPNVWALSLPTGAVHLFQVGTPEISKEFVLTVNYWSARLSTHPLVGGISNVEYGWSDACINNALVNAINDNQIPPRPGSAAAGRSSMHSRQSSLRSSFDVGGTGARTKLPGDRIHIADWAPPTQSLRASSVSEAEQLDTLITYVRGIEDDLQKHNRLRSSMLLAFTPRGSNANKAMANWERKSSYLLREIVKFRTYVDCLQLAETRRKEIYGERDVARRAARGEEDPQDEFVDADETLKVYEPQELEHDRQQDRE